MPVSGVAITGKSLIGENEDFLTQFFGAVKAVGGTQVKVISAYRSPSYNAQIGGAGQSLHMQGLAIDADVFIPGKGWVPAGTALKPVANRFNIRSGDQPNFFRGAPDPAHVDAGLSGGYGGGTVTKEGEGFLPDIPNPVDAVKGLFSGAEGYVIRGLIVLAGFALVLVGLLFIVKAETGFDVTDAIGVTKLAKMAK